MYLLPKRQPLQSADSPTSESEVQVQAPSLFSMRVMRVSNILKT